jgi:hypothetical protein
VVSTPKTIGTPVALAAARFLGHGRRDDTHVRRFALNEASEADDGVAAAAFRQVPRCQRDLEGARDPDYRVMPSDGRRLQTTPRARRPAGVR